MYVSRDGPALMTAESHIHGRDLFHTTFNKVTRWRDDSEQIHGQAIHGEEDVLAERAVSPRHLCLMETAANIDDLAKIRPFPKMGIRLKAILEFVESMGGRDKFTGMSTDDACRTFVVPLTKDSKCCYCDYLSSIDPTNPDIGEATVFISHAWRYQFLNVLDALEKKFRGSDDFLWFDLLSNNQHNDVPPPFEWWCETFQGAIKSIGRVVMILEPWLDPIPLTRAWCLWEIFCTKSQNCKFEVLLPPSETAKLCEDIIDNSDRFFEAFGNMDVRNSKAFKITDQESIFAAIQQSVGFSELNSLVNTCIASEYLELVFEFGQVTINEAKARESLLALYQSDQSEALKLTALYISVGRFTNKTGRHQAAYHFMMKYLQYFNPLLKLPQVDDYLVSVLDVLAECCIQIKASMGEKSIIELKFLYELYWLHLHRQSASWQGCCILSWPHALISSVESRLTPAKLTVLDRMLVVQNSQSLFANNIVGSEIRTNKALLVRSIQHSERLIGATHPETLTRKESLIKVLLKRREFSEAIAEGEAILAIHAQQRGETNRFRSIDIALSMAEAMIELRQTDKAQALLDQYLPLHFEKRGAENRSYWQGSYLQALILFRTDRLEEAVVGARETFKNFKRLFGEKAAQPSQLLLFQVCILLGRFYEAVFIFPLECPCLDPQNTLCCPGSAFFSLIHLMFIPFEPSVGWTYCLMCCPCLPQMIRAVCGERYSGHRYVDCAECLCFALTCPTSVGIAVVTGQSSSTMQKYFPAAATCVSYIPPLACAQSALTQCLFQGCCLQKMCCQTCGMGDNLFEFYSMWTYDYFRQHPHQRSYSICCFNLNYECCRVLHCRERRVAVEG